MKFTILVSKLLPYYYRNHLFVSPDEITIQPPLIDSEYVIDFPVDITKYCKKDFENIKIGWETIKSIAELGHFIGIISWHGKIVHRSIVQIRGIASMEGDRHAFSLNPNEMYVHSCYTSSDHRGQGLYTAILHQIIKFALLPEKPTKIFIACRRENFSSVRGIQRSGFKYLKSSAVIGAVAGRVRLRVWYMDDSMDNA